MSNSIPPQSPDPDESDRLDMIDDLDRDMEAMSWNQLSTLGNRAIAMKLIVGHGFHRGQYEILHSGKALVMSPDEAVTYLQKLIRTALNG